MLFITRSIKGAGPRWHHPVAVAQRVLNQPAYDHAIYHVSRQSLYLQLGLAAFWCTYLYDPVYNRLAWHDRLQITAGTDCRDRPLVPFLFDAAVDVQQDRTQLAAIDCIELGQSSPV